jgi:hypothetical protein
VAAAHLLVTTEVPAAAGRGRTARSGSGSLRCGTAMSVRRRDLRIARDRARRLVASLAPGPPRPVPNQRSGSNAAGALSGIRRPGQQTRPRHPCARAAAAALRVAPPAGLICSRADLVTHVVDYAITRRSASAS